MKMKFKNICRSLVVQIYTLISTLNVLSVIFLSELQTVACKVCCCPTSLARVEGVCGGDSLYLGGEGGVGQEVQAVDGLHTPSEHSLRGHALRYCLVTDVKKTT